MTIDYTELPLEDQLFAIKRERKQIKDRDEELKLLQAIVERNLGDRMVEEGTAFVERTSGESIRMSQHISVKPKCDRDDAATWLKNHPLFDALPRLSFDSRKLSSIVEQIKEEGGTLPAEFEEMFAITPYYKITTSRV